MGLPVNAPSYPKLVALYCEAKMPSITEWSANITDDVVKLANLCDSWAPGFWDELPDTIRELIHDYEAMHEEENRLDNEAKP